MVCSAGQKSRSLYCVQEGQLEVLIEGQVIRVLEPGDSFGEVTALWLFDCLKADSRQSHPRHSMFLSQIWLGA